MASRSNASSTGGRHDVNKVINEIRTLRNRLSEMAPISSPTSSTKKLNTSTSTSTSTSFTSKRATQQKAETSARKDDHWESSDSEHSFEQLEQQIRGTEGGKRGRTSATERGDLGNRRRDEDVED